MANSFLKILLGLYPKTEKIEGVKAALIAEYEELKQFSSSDGLAHFLELEKYVISKEFDDYKKSIESKKFETTEEYQKLQQYTQLKKSKTISDYYRAKSSKELQEFKNIDASQVISKFEELEKIVGSKEFLDIKAYAEDKKRFEKSEEFKVLQDYLRIKKSADIIGYFSFIKAKEFNDFKALNNSSELNDFEDLEKFVQSPKFITDKSSLDAKTFKQSEEFSKYQQYLRLKKSKAIKNYYKLKNSPSWPVYNKMLNSQELSAFEDLEKYIKSSEFIEKKKVIESVKFSDTPEYQKWIEHKNLKNSSNVKFYYKYKASPIYANYLLLDGSQQIEDYEKLEKFINSDEFKQVKEYMEDKKKFEKTEAFQKQQEYLGLKKSEKIVWYFNVKDSNKFEPLKQWSLTFEDDFSGGKLDRDKWMTRYFWGEALLNDTYSMMNDKQHYTNGENLEFNDSVVKIVTKKQKAQGKTWNPMLGFLPSEFDYTSGLISTGHSFRQKYGRFEAKIKINRSTEVIHAFWMVGETILPQVDFFKYVDNKLLMSNFWGKITEKDGVKKTVSKIKASRFANDFFIYTLDWSPERLEWKINGLTVKTQTEGVPQEPMYVVFNSVVNKTVSESSVPVAMEIDWVRCYQKA